MGMLDDELPFPVFELSPEEPTELSSSNSASSLSSSALVGEVLEEVEAGRSTVAGALVLLWLLMLIGASCW